MNVPAAERTLNERLQQRSTVRLLVYGLLAVLLMAMDHRGAYLQSVRDAGMQVVLPLYRALDWPQRRWQALVAFIDASGAREARIVALQRSLRELQAQQLQHEALLRENARLRTLLAGVERTGLKVKLADIVAVDMDPYTHQVVINQGRLAGVRRGMSVVDASGLLGQVSEVAVDSASVILISDADHAIPLRNLRNGLRMVAYGRGDHRRLEIRDLPDNADLRPGDMLVTSGLGGRFPAGLAVAEVVADAPAAPTTGGPFGLRIARPLANLAEASQVLVVE
jgi:rod shape-determining protein MreC